MSRPCWRSRAEGERSPLGRWRSRSRPVPLRCQFVGRRRHPESRRPCRGGPAPAAGQDGLSRKTTSRFKRWLVGALLRWADPTRLVRLGRRRFGGLLAAADREVGRAAVTAGIGDAGWGRRPGRRPRRCQSPTPTRSPCHGQALSGCCRRPGMAKPSSAAAVRMDDRGSAPIWRSSRCHDQANRCRATRRRRPRSGRIGWRSLGSHGMRRRSPDATH